MNSSIAPDDTERRAEIARRRFFGDDGLIARYERIGDDLVQFGKIVAWLMSALPGLDRAAVTARFVLSAQYGDFGFRDYGPRRRAVASLIDLDGLKFALGQYPLRPSTLTVAMRPYLMRARRSVWAAWLRLQGWPLPSWLGHFAPIEATASPMRDAGLGPRSPRGFRTSHEASAEAACREWIANLTERPANIDAAFAAAQVAVKDFGLLSRKAFDRAWAANARPEWRKGGRRKKHP